MEVLSFTFSFKVKFMRSFKNIINFLFKACPYSFIGRKCFDAVKGKTRSHTNKNLNDRILSFKLGIKTGRNIILIGVFCPILWYSILSGANKKFIELNLIHSAIIVGLGLLVMLVNYIALFNYRRTI
ncbi:MAG: hypothetical protein CMH14_17770 [Mesonia sp.]|nr:hypothetical protein [Mesonia sp.]